MVINVQVLLLDSLLHPAISSSQILSVGPLHVNNKVESGSFCGSPIYTHVPGWENTSLLDDCGGVEAKLG